MGTTLHHAIIVTSQYIDGPIHAAHRQAAFLFGTLVTRCARRAHGTAQRAMIIRYILSALTGALIKALHHTTAAVHAVRSREPTGRVAPNGYDIMSLHPHQGPDVGSNPTGSVVWLQRDGGPSAAVHTF